ncbi:MAG: bifunctional DNA primase/polymerase [Candidatus Binatia bacterium]|nr:bifunctional DNA primase/polymerase [Candidatus Binatia bacterium]
MVEKAKNNTAALPSTVGEVAEFYATHFKWRIFPLYEVAPSGVCSCKKGGDCPTPGKHPRVSIPSGEKAVHPATHDLKQVKAWWKKWPLANIGFWLEGADIIVLDIDKNDKKDGFKGLTDIMAFEEQEFLPKTMTCNTPSGGKHLYFKYRDGVPNKANALGPGLDTWHSKHYVILPSSNHLKGIYTWDKGQGGEMEKYPDWLLPRSRVAAVEGGVVTKKVGRPAKEKIDPRDPEDVERIKYALKHVDATNRDYWVMAGFALARAFDWSDAGFAIYNVWSATAHNYDEKKTAEQYYKQSKTVPTTPITTASIFEWARSHPDYKGWTPSDDRPYEIRERDSDQLGVLIEIGKIVEHFNIYQRGPKIVEIVPVNKDDGSGGITDSAGNWYPKGAFILREVQPDQLAMRILPAKTRWMKKTMKGWKSTAVSIPLCSAFLNIGNWPNARKLRAFTQHPTLRDDGSLLLDPGYDRRSGLFLTNSLPVQVNLKAKLKDAQKALKTLMYPFHEFKWIDGPVSFSALMAALFTVGIRHLFDEGVPLFAIDAPRQGSGKTKLVKSISNLWFGRPMATTPYSSDHEEMKKHLAAMLMNGDRMVLFDNVHPSVRINDPTLNALLTAGRVTFRELGSQRMIEFDSAATFFMTGNSLKIMGDMIRRTIRVQIDPEGLHPIDRKFTIDPLESYILEHRMELLSAALTILVAYHNAGCPKPASATIASFEKWSDKIRSMLLWLDLDDVKESISQGYEQDDESMEIEHLLHLLYNISELYGDGLTSAMILPLVSSDKALRDAMLPFMNQHTTHGIDHPRVVTTILSQVAKITVDKKRLLRLGPVWVVRDEE